MNIYFKRVFDYLKKSKMLTEVIAEKITAGAQVSSKNIRQYIYDDANVTHVALIVYDLLPFPVKLSMRYDNFHSLFLKNFSSIRALIFSNPEISEQPKILKQVSKNVKIKAKKIVTKKVSKKPLVSKVSKKAITNI